MGWGRHNHIVEKQIKKSTNWITISCTLKLQFLVGQESIRFLLKTYKVTKSFNKI